MAEKKVLNIHESMLKFHAEFNGVDKTGFNPHFKSKHFSLEDLIHTTTPILHKHGLYVVQYIEDGCMCCQIRNAAGEFLTSAIPMSLTANPQANGSLVTYYRRYNLVSLLNIAEKDDDAEAAMVAADLDEQRNRRQAVVPKPMATEAQRLLLQDFVASGDLNVRQVKYIEANIDKLTVDDAKELLAKIKGEV